MNLAAAPVALSPLHSHWLRLGAEMTTRDGWQVPAHFGSVEAEIRAARGGVAFGERGGGQILEAVGEGVPEMATHLDVSGIAPGAAGPVPRERARWCRLARDQARLLHDRGSDPARIGSLVPDTDCLHVTDLSAGLTTFAILGPRSPDLLARLIRLDLDPARFADRRLAQTGAAGVPVFLLRWDRGGILAYELAAGRDVAVYLWERLLHAGETLDVAPMGLDAMHQMENENRPGAESE